VTTADLQQDTFVGIHAVYQEKRYPVSELGRYFVALDHAWRASLALASRNADVRDAMQAGALAYLRRNHPAGLAEAGWERFLQIGDAYSWFDAYEEEETLQLRLRQLGDAEMAKIDARLLESKRLNSISLTVSQLSIESPMELTLAVVHGTGVSALVAYGVHLLVHVMRDPERVGAWLPRLVAGWHKGMAEVEHARLNHREAEAERKRRRAIEDASDRLMAAVEKIKDLPAAQATAIGAGDTPDDIVAALSE
jgi:hypothetical protein